MGLFPDFNGMLCDLNGDLKRVFTESFPDLVGCEWGL